MFRVVLFWVSLLLPRTSIIPLECHSDASLRLYVTWRHLDPFKCSGNRRNKWRFAHMFTDIMKRLLKKKYPSIHQAVLCRHVHTSHVVWPFFVTFSCRVSIKNFDFAHVSTRNSKSVPPAPVDSQQLRCTYTSESHPSLFAQRLHSPNSSNRKSLIRLSFDTHPFEWIHSKTRRHDGCQSSNHGH